MQLHISEHIHKLLNYDSYSKKRENQISYMRNNVIQIHAEKKENYIIFYIIEKNSKQISKSEKKSFNHILSEENKFIAKELRLSALCDLINFEKIFYGVVARNIYKNLSTGNDSQVI